MDRFRLDVANLLSQAGCDVFGEADLREAARECRDEIYLDELEHAGDVDSPFFDFLVVPAKDSKDIAVFTFFEESFSIYVFDCDETTLIAQFNGFAMAETEPARRFLASAYGKVAPDLSVGKDVLHAWIGPPPSRAA